MVIKRMPINQFMEGVRAALNRKDGYIMGATGQNQKRLAYPVVALSPSRMFL